MAIVLLEPYMYEKVTKRAELGAKSTLCFALYLLLGRYILLAPESCVDVHGAALGGINTAPRKLISFQAKTDHVGAGRDLNASGGKLAGGDAIHEDLRAGGGRIHLSPGDMAGSGLGFEVAGRLDIVLHLNLANIGFVAFETQDEIVGARGEGQSGGGLAGLLVAVDEDVSAWRACAHEKTFGQ